jgi:hypothetical protein
LGDEDDKSGKSGEVDEFGEINGSDVSGDMKVAGGSCEDEIGLGLGTMEAAGGCIEPGVVLEAAKDLTAEIEEVSVGLVGGIDLDDRIVVEVERDCLEWLQVGSSLEENGEKLGKVGSGAVEIKLGCFKVDLLGLYC